MEDSESMVNIFFAYVSALVVFLICVAASYFFALLLVFFIFSYGDVNADKAIFVFGFMFLGLSIFLSVKVFQISMRRKREASTLGLVLTYAGLLLLCGWIQSRTMFFGDRFAWSIVGFFVSVVVFMFLLMRNFRVNEGRHGPPSPRTRDSQ